MKKDLKEKAIDFKGKKYVLVSDRVLYFNEEYPNGAIETVMLSDNNADRVIFRTTVIPDVANPMRRFTGYSQATWGDGYINKTSAIENAETSSVGRALAFLGIGVLDSIASADEINKAKNTEKANNELGVCEKCGAPMVVSQKGTKYCSKLCWKTEDKAKVQGYMPKKMQKEKTAEEQAEFDNFMQSEIYKK